MFVKHIIKTLHVPFTIVLPFSGGRLSCLVLLLSSLLVFVVKLFIWYVAVCCLCACVPDVFVCGMFGSQPNKQLAGANKQRSSNSTKHERRPPEDGKTIVNETCRFLMMCFRNIFLKFSVLNVNVF
jgi:hypothetical protein